MRNCIVYPTLLIVAASTLAGCDKSARTATDADGPTPFGMADQHPPEDERYARDLHSEDIDTSGTRGGRTYAKFDALRDREALDAFEGFGCLGSCEGHKAGFNWADANANDLDECRGKSWSFTEGCAASVLKRSEADATAASPGEEIGLF